MEFSQTAKNIGFEDGDIILSADGEHLEMFGEEMFRKVVESKEVKVLRSGDTASIVIPDDFMIQMLQDKKGFANYRIPFVVKNVIDNSPAFYRLMFFSRCLLPQMGQMEK